MLRFPRVDAFKRRPFGLWAKALIGLLFLLPLTLWGLGVSAPTIKLSSIESTVYALDVHVSGRTTPNEPVQALLNGAIAGKTTANASGDFVMVVSPPLGASKLQVVSSRPGLFGARSGEIAFRRIAVTETIDTLSERELQEASRLAAPAQKAGASTAAAPPAPTLNATPATATGNPIVVTGVATAGTVLTIYVNGVEVRSISLASASFSEWVPLDDGLNTIYATSTNALGEVSPASNSLQTTYTNAANRTVPATITQNTVWTKGDGSPYLVGQNVQVAAGATLWVQSGVAVSVQGNYRIDVNGQLVVRGRATAKATFRPVTASCTDTAARRQDWGGMYAVNGGRIDIEHAEVRCASRGVSFFNATGSVRQSSLLGGYYGVRAESDLSSNPIAPSIGGGNVIRANSSGIYILRNASPAISGGNEITANAYGIYVDGNDVESANPKPVVTGNSIYANTTNNYYATKFGNPDAVVLNATGNWWGSTNISTISASIRDRSDTTTGAPWVDYSGYLGAAGGTNAFTGGTLNGRLTASRTLAAGQHQVQGNTYVPAGMTLTLDAGAQLVVARDTTLTVDGTLIINGTPSSRATFRSANTAPAKEDWKGILVVGAGIAQVSGALIEHADWGIQFLGGEGTVSGSILRNNTSAIWVGENSSPTISGGNEITANTYGIYVDGNDVESANPKPVVTGNSIYANTTNNYYATKFGNPDAVVLNATGNWWGSTNISTISATIRDRSDTTTGVPWVDYSGYLGAAGGTSAFTGSVLNGRLTASRTLVAGPHQIQGDTYVPAGMTLTIEPGAQLQVAKGMRLTVDGALVISGSSASRVNIQSANTTPAKSDWDGISILNSGTATISGALIEHADWAFGFFGGEGTVSNSIIRNSRLGIYIEANSSPTISGGNEITANTYGLYVYGNNVEAANPKPVVTGNSIYANTTNNYYTSDFANPNAVVLNATGNWWGSTNISTISGTIRDRSDTTTGAPWVDYSGYLGAAGGTNAFAGGTLNGPLTASRTLAAGPHQIQGDTYVPLGMTLTVDAGAQVQAAQGARLTVDGSLIINGMPASRVTFQSANTTPSKSAWEGIVIGNTGTVSIAGLISEHATWGVAFAGGEGTVTTSILRNNEQGIRVEANSSPTISGGNEITANTYGVYVYGNNVAAANPIPVVTGNSIYANTANSYYSGNFGNPDAVVLNATGNWWGSANVSVIASGIRDRSDTTTGAPYVDYSGYLGAMGGSAVFSGSRLLGTIPGNQTLSAGNYLVIGDVTIPAGVTMTLQPDARLFFATGRRIYAFGNLVAVGTPSQRITFGSAANSPAKGDWVGLQIDSGGSATLENIVVQHSTYGVDFFRGGGSLKKSLIRLNTHGVYVEPGMAPTIGPGNEITQNDYGIYLEANGSASGNPTPAVTGNAIYGNDTRNVYSRSYGAPVPTLDFSGNWWNQPDEAAIRSTFLLQTPNPPLFNLGGALAATPVDLAIRLTNVAMSVPRISPLGTPSSAQGSYTVSEPGSVQIAIRRDSDNAVVQQINQSPTAAGGQNFAWDGKDTAGAIVPPGMYRAVVTAADVGSSITFDPPPVSSITIMNSGTATAIYRPLKNQFYRAQVTLTKPGLLTMSVTPQGGTTFYPVNRVYYPAGPQWVIWDGRDPAGQLITVPVQILIGDTEDVRATAIQVLGAAPEITGLLPAPDIEIKADPYLVVHSFEQITRMAFRVSADSDVRFALLPPGVTDIRASNAVVLLDNVRLNAKTAGGAPLDHTVEWRGYDPAKTAQVRVAPEGAYTFAIEAKSAATGQVTLYRGAVTLRQ
jgi:nitrous oxidase accessory protein NosD